MTAAPAVTGPSSDGAATGSAPAPLPVARLNLARGGYAVMGLGLAVFRWPQLAHTSSWTLMGGVVTCMLVAMSVLALLGLRHPAALLPVLVLECAWKVLWLGVVALPAWVSGSLDADTRGVAGECLGVVLVIAVVPWRYVLHRYLSAPGDPWRSPRVAPGARSRR